jgi:preprotein translocase subunit YajC
MNFILWIPLIALVGWFLIVRPQRNARKRATELASTLEVGDEVVTVGGLFGYIVTIDDREVDLDVAEGVTLRFARRAIAGKAPVDAPEDEELEDDDLEDDELEGDEEDDDLEDDGELGEDDELDDNFEHGDTSDEEPVIETAPNADESPGR